MSRRLKCTIVITHCPLSIVRPSLSFNIFDFSSVTAEQNSTKLVRKQDLKILHQVCVFEANNKTPWPLIGLAIFDFSSETVEWNSKKLGRKQHLNVLYYICFFGPIGKNKVATLASDWLRYFPLLLWNYRREFNQTWQEARSLPWSLIADMIFLLVKAEFNETWQDARSQRPLPILCFSDRSEKQVGRPGLWLAETVSISPLKRLNGIQRNLIWSKISMRSTEFVFFRKQDGRPGLW